MSRLSRRNKYDSDRDYSVEVDKIKPYDENEAYSVYVPPTDGGKKKMSKDKKMGKGKKAVLIILLIIFILIVAVATAFFVLRWQGGKMKAFDNADISTIDGAVTENDGKTVIYNGKTYRLNENITSIACLGIDKESLGTYGDKIGTAGQADTNLVLAIDTALGKVTVISIPRDTMVDVGVYTTKGEYVGTNNEQLCLAYAYGDGKETSCKNSVASIERVLFGMPVNSYIALDLDGIGAINDSIGGVTVTSTETIAQFTAGQSVTLHGNEAMNYVRARGDDVNASLRRMERQISYVNSFSHQALSAAKKNIGSVTRLYNTTMKYCSTNIGLDNVTYLATVLLAKGMNGVDTVSLPGEMKLGTTYAEYYMDTVAAYEMILGVFYNEVA